MVVQLLVVVRAHVGAVERLFEVLEERRIHGHHVLEVTVDRAILDHQDLAVALDNPRLDLPDLLGEQHLVVALAVENLLARLAHARRAERISLTRPAKWRLDLLPRFEQRLLRPLWRERLVRLDAVEGVEHGPRAFGGDRHALLDVLDRLVHNPPASGDPGSGPADVRQYLDEPRVSARPGATYKIVVKGHFRGVIWRLAVGTGASFVARRAARGRSQGSNSPAGRGQGQARSRGRARPLVRFCQERYRRAPNSRASTAAYSSGRRMSDF